MIYFIVNLLNFQGKIFNLITKIFILANINNKKELQDIGIPVIDEIYFTHFKAEKAHEEREVINDLIVDIFLILTNEPQAVEYMKEKKILNAFNKLKIRNSNDQEMSDKLFVITNYLNY